LKIQPYRKHRGIQNDAEYNGTGEERQEHLSIQQLYRKHDKIKVLT